MRKIVLDANIWVSFAIGKRLSVLPVILQSKNMEVYCSAELIREIMDVCARPKISKYVNAQRTQELIDLIASTTTIIKPQSVFTVSSDADDDYLFSICHDADADFLVTSDKDLISIKHFEETQIISFNQLLSLIRK